MIHARVTAAPATAIHAERNTMNRIGFIVTGLLILLGLLSSMLFVVDQRQYGVLYALGQIKEVITEPGLNFKLPPPFQDVKYLDKRLLTLDSTDTEPVLTAEKQRLVIDWYLRWRITNPSEYIRAIGVDEAAGANQLSREVRNAFQEEISKRTVRELISTKREALMAEVKREVQEKVQSKNWGMEIIDVRLTRADYVDAITESVYRRMEAERKRVANELRSTGAAEGEKIRADADRQREVTIANAYRDAQKIKGDGDAQAAGLYGEAFGRDPQFAQFYRSLDAYKASFSKKGDVVVVDQSSEFFRAMRGNAAAGAPAAPARK
jgi:modulator of FtsH protease HflC